jgi:hypothetical protein
MSNVIEGRFQRFERQGSPLPVVLGGGKLRCCRCGRVWEQCGWYVEAASGPVCSVCATNDPALTHWWGFCLAMSDLDTAMCAAPDKQARLLVAAMVKQNVESLAYWHWPEEDDRPPLDPAEDEPADHSHVFAVQDHGGSQERWVGNDEKLTFADARKLADDMGHADTLVYRTGNGEQAARRYGDRLGELISSNVAPGWDGIWLTPCTSDCRFEQLFHEFGERESLSRPYWTPATGAAKEGVDQ